MADFNIGIVSTLDIDPKSSASQINRTIGTRSFRDQLDAVKIKLEAYMTKEELGTFRKTVRDALSEENLGNANKVQVKVEVDQKQVVNTLNKSLEEASKKLKAIKVDIDAQVDEEALKRNFEKATPKSAPTPKATPSSSSTDAGAYKEEKRTNDERVRGNKLSGEQRDILADVRQTLNLAGNEAVALNRSYESTEAFVEDVLRSLRSTEQALSVTNQQVNDLENGHKRVTIQAERYNKELQKTQTHRLTADLGEDGQVTPKNYSIRNADESNAVQDRNKAIRSIENEIAANERRISQHSPIKAALESQNKSYRELAQSTDVTSKRATELINKNNNSRIAKEAENRAIQLQTRLLNTHSKAMQQNHRHIDKGGMKTLLGDLQRVNTASNTALPQLNNLQQQMNGYVNQAAQATRSQMGLMENFSNAMVKFPIWMGASTLFFGAIQSAKTFITTITDIDSKMITLQKVMSDSADMNQVFEDARVSAERFGQTLSSVLDAYAEFARQGYEGADLTNFGNAALIASNVGEIGAQEASEFLTAANAQWETASQDAMGQVDSWNNIANNYATTVEKLGEGQAKAGSSARAMGLDFDQTNAVIGALTAQTKQSGSEIGNFIKAVFPRAYTVSKNVFEDLNISLQDAEGNTKSAIALYREAAFAMEGMNTAEQADVVRGLGGTHHYQRMQVLLDTLRDTSGLYDQIYEASVNSDGSAAAENAIYMESLEAQVNKAKVAIEEFALALGDLFLEAGILEFLTSFTQVMNGLASFLTEHPVLAKAAFGTSIALLLTMSKGVRDFYGNLMSLPQAYQRVQASAQATARANQISMATGGSVGVAATPGIIRATQDLNKQASATMVLNNAQQTLGKTSKTTQASTMMLGNATASTSRTQTAASSVTAGQVMQTRALGKVSSVTTGALRGLGVAFRGLAAATGVGLVITGITWGLEKLINTSADATNATNEYTQTQDVLKQSMEQDADAVDDLVSAHTRLESKIQSGNYTNEELEEHKNVTEQLSMLFPDLVAGTEEYGTALVNQQGIMQARIDLIQNQIDNEKELARVQAESARQERMDAGKQAEADLNESSYGGFAASDIDKAMMNLSSIAPTDEFEKQAQQITDIQKLNEYANALVDEKNRLLAESPELHQREIEKLDESIAKTQGYLQETGISQNQILDGISARGEEFMINAQAFIDTTQGLGNATGSFLGNFANQVIAISDSGKQAEQVFGSLMGKLQDDTGFVNQMRNYETAMEDFQNTAANTPERLAATNTVITQFEQLEVAITQAMEALGFDDTEIQKMIAGMKEGRNATLGLKDGTDGTIDSMEQLKNETAEATSAQEELTYAWQKASDTVSGFKDEIGALDKEMSVISSAMEQLTETGGLDPSKFAEVLEILPEFANHIGSADEMLQFLQSRYGELSEEQRRALGEMILTQQDANDIQEEDAHNTEQNKLTSQADRIDAEDQNERDHLAANAEIGLVDEANKASIEKSKADKASARVQLENEREAWGTNQKGDHYETDDGNFKALAVSKETVEGLAVESIGGFWGGLISWVYGAWSTLTNWASNAVDGIRGALGAPTTGAVQTGILGTDEFADVYNNAPPAAPGDFKVEGSLGALGGLDLAEAKADQQELDKAIDDLLAKNPAVTKALDDNAKAHRDLADSGAGSGKALKDFDKSAKDAKEEAEKAKDKVKELDVEVEELSKTFQKQTYILDQHEERLRKINFQIEKQNLQTEKYATHSANYRKALQQENKLNHEKLRAMEAQEKSLSNQIKNGRINEYGLVSEDLNVLYNQYNATTSGSGDKVQKTATVTAAKSSGGGVSPFAGWKVNYGYSPQGGGAYGRQIGFNGGRHYGVDFGGRTGQAIRTPHGGQVVSAGWSPYGGGNQVEVYNKALDKTFTFMHMLGDLSVRAGQTIQAGQQVGRMGSTGNSTGTHLHFQVNSGRGINNARSVNPNSYLSSSNQSYVGAVQSAVTGSTATPSQLGNKISEETASYLNEVEQARLASVEKAVEQHNAGEENKSKVQEARENLDSMVLERLQLMAQIRETEYAIIESQIEYYEVEKNKLNHKIAELEYKADNQARLKGETSDSEEWRKWMNKAQTEREKQLRRQQEQVSYIQSVLTADSRKSRSNRMNEAHRFQLEETMRSAKEEVINLKRAVDEAETGILTSRVNQSMNEMDEALEAIDNKITLIQHKRNFLDSTYQDGAGEYVFNLAQEVKLLEQREREYNKSLKTLKALRSNLRQQPELYEQVNDRIKDSEAGLREVEAAVYDLGKEIQSMEIDKMFERLNKRLETAQKKFLELQDAATYINQDSQPDLYYNNQADLLTEMVDYQKIIKNNIKQLESMLDKVKQFPEIHKQVTDEIKNWEEQYKTTNQEMHSIRAEFAGSFIESVKQIYEAQRTEAIRVIDDEMEAYEKMINKKLELIDDQAEEDQYNDDIADRQEALQELRDEIAQRMGDDSLQNQRILKDLQEELADAEEEYNKFISNKQREDRKKALQEELSDAQENADDRRENTNDLFDDMANDQRAFNEMQEEIMKGSIEKYKGLYQELTDFVADSSKEIGRSISEGMLDGINTPYEALVQLTSLLGTLNGSAAVPESGLRPTNPELGGTISDLINGVDNNLTLQNLGLTPTVPTLSTKPVSTTSTTHNSNQFAALLNVENFRGSQKELDGLMSNLDKEMRKRGISLR